MARFGQGLFSGSGGTGLNMMNAQLAQVGQNLGAAVPTARRVMQERQDETQFRQLMSQAQQALASKDSSALATIAANLSQIGKQEQAMALSQAAQKISGEAEASARSRGVQGGLAYFTQAAARGVPFEQLQEGIKSVIGLDGSAQEAFEAYQLGLPKDTDNKFFTGVTEWVDADGNVALKTVQPQDSSVLVEVGSNRKVGANELLGLTKKTSAPSTTVNVGAGEKAYTTEMAKLLSKQDAEVIEGGVKAQDNLATIAEARVILEESDEVLGVGANTIQAAKGGVLRLMNIMGVSEEDPLYQKLGRQTAAGDLYKVFTQEFVKERLESTKGAISDTEFKTFMASVPEILQSPEGYKQVLDYMERASTYAVLKADLYNKATISPNAQEEVRKAKSLWDAFSREFPPSVVSASSATSIFEDFQKPGFSKQRMRFEIQLPDGKTKKMTYDDIIQDAKARQTSPALAMRRLFNIGNAYYTGLGEF